MSEKTIEKEVVDFCKSNNWKVVKYKDPSKKGAPDRIVLTNEGLCFFVELKEEGKEPRLEQLIYMGDLLKRGFIVFIIEKGDTLYKSSISFFVNKPSLRHKFIESVLMFVEDEISDKKLKLKEKLDDC